MGHAGGPPGRVPPEARTPGTLGVAVLTAAVIAQLALSAGASWPARAEELVCCGTVLPAAPDPRDPRGPGFGGIGPEHCCGRGWGLHCCVGDKCCQDEAVVLRPGPPPAPTRRPPSRPRPPPPPPAQPKHAGIPWGWKEWAQWLNLAVIILVVALVTAVLVCCWRCEKATKWTQQQRQLLRLGDDKYGYGAISDQQRLLSGPTVAPSWSPPITSHWMDFSLKPTVGTTPKLYGNPYYSSAPPVRNVYQESVSDIQRSPVFSSSDEEYKLITEFKKKTTVPS